MFKSIKLMLNLEVFAATDTGESVTKANQFFMKILMRIDIHININVVPRQSFIFFEDAVEK